FSRETVVVGELPPAHPDEVLHLLGVGGHRPRHPPSQITPSGVDHGVGLLEEPQPAPLVQRPREHQPSTPGRSSSAPTVSAPAARNTSPSPLGANATTRIPAASAASTPIIVSSTTT